MLYKMSLGGIFTFALGGTEAAPQFAAKEARQLIDLDFTATPEQIAHGSKIFQRYCGHCHGDGEIPSLSYSHPEIFESFANIVGEGSLLEKGMPDFGDRLSSQDISDVKHYILANAKEMRGGK